MANKLFKSVFHILIMKKRTATIALAQIKYFEFSEKHNIHKILYYIREAKKKNADIVCFPESCVLRKGSLELDHGAVKVISEECKKNSIWCIITDDFKKNGRVYNTSILINREGEIKGRYKKIHLYGDKTEAGKKSMVFKTDFGKIGVVICWDLAFPDLFRKMKKRGAEIVFCPAQWWYDSKAHYSNFKKKELKILRSLVLARAYENVFFVALCNPIVDSKFQVSYSAISSPTEILGEKIEKEGLLVKELDLREIERIQKIYDA